MNITSRKLNTLHGQVEYILENIPNTRNSDLSLQAELAQAFYPPLESAITNWKDIVIAMRNVPTLDHIARVRRKVIESNKYEKYLPTNPDVAKARGIEYNVWQDYAKRHNFALEKKLPSRFNVPKGYEVIDE